MGERNSDQIIAECTEIIRLRPSNAGAYFQRGIAYSVQWGFDRAIADLTEAIRLTPNYPSAYCFRGLAYKCKWYHNEMIKNVNRLAKDSGDSLVSLEYGEAIPQEDKSPKYADQMIADFEMAVKLDPNNAGYREMLEKAKMEYWGVCKN